MGPRQCRMASASPRRAAEGTAMMTHRPEPHEIVPQALRSYLRWDSRPDQMAAHILREFNLILPRDRELIRQLAFARVQQGATR
jgi:hypothetical protein